MAKQKREILIDLELESRDYNKELGDVNKELKNNRKQIKDLSKDYDSNAEEIARLELANKKLAESKRDIIKESKLEDNSLNGLRRRIIQLKKERDDLDTSIEGNAKRFNDLTLEIKETTEQVKGFEEAGGDFRRNVGNYTNSILEAGSAMGGMGGAVAGIIPQVQGLFTLLKANPIGLVIAAITTLIGLFNRSRTAMNFLADATAAFSAGLNVLIDRIEMGVLAFGKLLKGDYVGFFTDVKEAATGIGDEIAREAAAAQTLSAALRRVNTELQIINQNRRESIRDQEELKNLRDNELISIDRRIAANEKLFQIEEKFSKQALEVAEKRVAIATQILAQRRQEGESIDDVIRRLSTEDAQVQQLIEARTELADIEEESIGRQNEFIMNRQSLLREQAADEIALLEAKAEAEILQYGETSERVLDIQRELIRKRTEMELFAVGEDQTKRQAIIQAARNEELELERNFIQKRKELEQEEAEAFDAMLDAEVEREQGAMDAKNKVYKEGLDKSFEDQQEFDKKELAATKAKEQAKQAIAQNTLAIFAALDKQGKASAIAQIIYDKAVAIGAAIKGATQAASATGPAAPFTLAAYITSMVGAVVGGFAQVSQILKADTGGTDTAFVRNPNGGGSVVPTLNGNAVNLAAFNQDNAGVGILGAAVAAQETQAQSQAQSVGNQVAANMPEIFVSLTEFDRAQQNVNAKITEATLGG